MPLIEGRHDLTAEQYAEMVRQRVERDKEHRKRAFYEWWNSFEPGQLVSQSDIHMAVNAWVACWKYLRPKELVEKDFKGG